jgi:hypothetical protein
MATKTKKSEEVEPIEASTVIKKRIEEKKVQDRVAIGPHIVYETTRREGEEELKRSTSSLAWSGGPVDGLLSGCGRPAGRPFAE